MSGWPSRHASMNSIAQPTASAMSRTRSRPSASGSKANQKTKPCHSSPVIAAATASDDHGEPDVEREQADPPVAGDELRGAGQHQRHQHQRDGAPEAHARGAVAGAAAVAGPGGGAGSPVAMGGTSLLVRGWLQGKSRWSASITSHTRHSRERRADAGCHFSHLG